MEVNWKQVAQSRGYKSLKAAYIRDVRRISRTGHPFGGRDKEFFYQKFKWVIGRPFTPTNPAKTEFKPEGILYRTIGGGLFDGGSVTVAGKAQIYPTEEGMRLVYETPEWGKSAIDWIPYKTGETHAWIADDKNWGVDQRGL